MIWEKIVETTSDILCAGNVLSSNAAYPYEERIEIMLYDNLEADKGMGLICTTGHYSGRIIVHLPIESRFQGKDLCVSWLINNWTHWVLPDSDINQVFMSTGYEVS